jgi:predicted amidophosphoribosyltransferase
VSTEPLSSLETIICGRCATVCDPDDDFCRHCGMALSDERLPSVRNAANVPAVWQPRIRGVAVKSAAFIAAGTVAEMLVRRMVRRALAPLAGKPRPARGRTEMISSDAGEGVESETLLLRHIRIRR